MITENTGTGRAHETSELSDENQHRDTPETISSESSRTTAQQNLSEPKGSETTETVTGFAPFRAWANKNIRNLPGGVKMQYGGMDYAVTEITHDGQLRLERDGRAVLIPFDERYIELVLKQIS